MEWTGDLEVVAIVVLLKNSQYILRSTKTVAMILKQSGETDRTKWRDRYLKTAGLGQAGIKQQ